MFYHLFFFILFYIFIPNLLIFIIIYIVYLNTFRKENYENQFLPIFSSLYFVLCHTGNNVIISSRMRKQHYRNIISGK